MLNTSEVIMNLARLGIRADAEAVRLYLRRVLRQTAKLPEHSGLRAQLGKLLVGPEASASSFRGGARAPVDATTFQSLLRAEDVVAGDAPLLDATVLDELEQILEEHRQIERLRAAGLEPTRSVLLVGPPGVGKTMTARYLAHALELPLLTLDLATVMSSLLGRTGQNLRSVLDHARAQPCVLLLDEFDALAKRRDDPTDIGELKRIVNVLLLEIENWPTHGVLVAATNHPEILDRAVERRFGRVLSLPLPSTDIRHRLIERALAGAAAPEDAPILEYAAALTEGQSGSAIVRLATDAVRQSLLTPGLSPAQALLMQLRARGISRGAKAGAITSVVRVLVVERGMPYREAAALIGVSHMTVSRAVASLTEESAPKPVTKSPRVSRRPHTGNAAPP